MSQPSEILIEHVQSPCNAGVMSSPDAVGRADLDGRAPRMTIFLRICGGIVERADFQTFGCGYSIACCSVLTERVKGMELHACREISSTELADTFGGLPANKRFCADLAIRALHAAITDYEENQHDG